MQGYVPMQMGPPPAKNNNALIAVVVVVVVAVIWYMNNKSSVTVAPVTTGSNASGGTTNTLVPVTPAAPAAPAFTGPFVGQFNADNYLSVLVNGVQVHAEQGIDWNIAHTVNIPLVTAGDRIDFNVRNAGGPGGFIGSWSWNGTTYNVGPTLFPNDTAIQGAGPWGQSILNQYPGAQWMWSPDNCEVCTHTFSWTAK